MGAKNVWEKTGVRVGRTLKNTKRFEVQIEFLLFRRENNLIYLTSLLFNIASSNISAAAAAGI